MPKRVIDFDAMWASDKLAACAEWAQPEYAWLYGLADCAGCFELTNLRVIWGRVSAIRRSFSLERLEQVFDEFHAQGLLFVWSECGKRYGHWTGSDVPGRLPPPSWRNRLERLAPPVPREQLAEYVAAHSAGVCARASHGAFASVPVRAPVSGRANARSVPLAPFDASSRGGGTSVRAPLKLCLEVAPAQDLDLDREGNGDLETLTHVLEDGNRVCESPQGIFQSSVEKEKSRSEQTAPEPNAEDMSNPGSNEFVAPDCTLRTSSKIPALGEPGLREQIVHAADECAETTNSPAELNDAGADAMDRNADAACALGIAAENATPALLGEMWEQERGTLPELRALTPERMARCRERISHARDRARFLADFREAVRRAANTPFLCGAGPAGWRANFDWIVANDTNYMKVLEGRYDAGAHNALGTRDEFAHRELRAGAGPSFLAPGSMRVRADVIERAMKRG